MAIRAKSKSADDIRRQTDNIYSRAIELLNSGHLSVEAYNSHLDKAKSVERRYIGNIRKQPLFRRENTDSRRNAYSTKYSQRQYMAGITG